MTSLTETVAKVRSDLRKLNRNTLQNLGAVEAREETEEAYVYT
jgi:hypothetical protein